MPFDWNQFFTLAERLANEADDASRRTAISRAYYYVFNLAFERAESTAGNYPGDEGFHTWCWKKYTKTPDLDCKRIGILGGRMKRRRVEADYNSAYMPSIERDTQSALQDARDFSVQLPRLNPRYPLP